nr:unnamed protein product [Digitaria exilis]
MHTSESSLSSEPLAAASASIADPYVLLKMVDGTIRLLIGGMGFLKICQLPSAYNYDNYWPVQKVPLHGTPHQVTYYAEQSLYPLIVSVPVVRPLNQVLSSMADQELGMHIENNGTVGDDLQKVYTVDEFEVRVMELEKSSGRWEARFTIPMQPFENALTVRIVTLQNTTTTENETLMAIGTAYVQGEDVAARGRVLLFSFSINENPQNLVMEVYSKESKGAVSAVASLQGHLLIASGPKITLNKWTGSELTAVAFYDAPLHVVSLNVSLQRKLVDAVPHVCGLNPRSFRHFNSSGKAHRPGPDNIIDFELLSHYEMLSLEEQLDIAQQIGTTRLQILANFSDFSLSTSFL